MDFMSGFHAVHHRHDQVEKDEVGMQLANPLDGFPAVRSLAANFDGLFHQEGANPAAYSLEIVDQ